DADDPGRDHRRSRPLVPRPRSAAADCIVGDDAAGRTVVSPTGAAACGLPRAGDRPDRARVQRPRRRAARHLRSAHDPLMAEPLLEVTDLSVRFETDDGPVHAVDRLSFTLAPGEVLGIVGESGCGKSVTCMSLVRLLPETAVIDGTAVFAGTDLLALPPKQLR